MPGIARVGTGPPRHAPSIPRHNAFTGTTPVARHGAQRRGRRVCRPILRRASAHAARRCARRSVEGKRREARRHRQLRGQHRRRYGEGCRVCAVGRHRRAVRFRRVHARGRARQPFAAPAVAAYRVADDAVGGRIQHSATSAHHQHATAPEADLFRYDAVDAAERCLLDPAARRWRRLTVCGPPPASRSCPTRSSNCTASRRTR